MKTIIDPAKLKVVELRAELSARGLDTKGNKAVLIDRLKDALSQEVGDDSSVQQPGETETAVEETSPAEDIQQEGVIVNPSEVEESHDLSPKKDIAEEVTHDQAREDDGLVEEKLKEPEVSKPEAVQPEGKPEVQSPKSKNLGKQQKEAEPAVAKQPQVEIKQEQEVLVKEEPMESEEVASDAAVAVSSPQVPTPKKEGTMQERKAEPEIKKEPDQVQTEVKSERRTTTRWSQVKEESNDTQATHKGEQMQGRGQKRQRSPSPEERNRSFREPPPRKPDDEPALDENAVLLGWYDSDLNLVINKDKGFLTATPMHDEGFAYVWAGARASHGIVAGKVYFESRITENCDISHLAEQEPNPNVLRIGWSTVENSMQLGEELLSFGYGGTGKASTNCSFKDYGRSFGLGDVVTAYLDMDSTPARISYSVNGEWQGYAYEVPKEKLEGKALFPHILSKNCGFECYFGSGSWVKQEPGKPGEGKDSEPWVGADAARADYIPIGRLEPHLRVPGPRRPEKRDECEAIMMVGLPACGKTTWANEWAKKHPQKLYNIMGTNSLIDKMKIMGLPRKRNYSGRWDVLIDKCTKCLVRLLALAGNRRRNYIIDQTNVYPSAQRRKMKGFEGFIRRAVVIVPTDEEFKKRQAKQEKVEGKDVPEKAVFEMKANFKLPEVGESFDEVIYVELGEQEARQLVMQYNQEAREAGYAPAGPPQKRFRGGGGGGGIMGAMNRDQRPLGRREPVRGGAPHHQPAGNSAGGRGGRGEYRARGGNWTPRGNWRDNRASYQSGTSGGSGGYRARGGGWRGGWGSGGNYRGGGGYDRNRAGGASASSGGRTQPSGAKGGWGGNWNSSGGSNAGGNWSGQGYGHGWGGQQGWKGYSPPSESGYGSQSNYSQDSYGSGGHYGSSDSVYSADGQGSYSQGAYDGSASQQGGYGSQGGQSSGGYGSAGGYGSSASAGATGSYSGADSGYGATATDWNQQYYQGYGNGSQSWNQGYGYGNQAPSGGSGFWQGSGSYGVAGGAAADATSGGYDYGAQGAAVGSGATGNGGYGK